MTSESTQPPRANKGAAGNPRLSAAFDAHFDSNTPPALSALPRRGCQRLSRCPDTMDTEKTTIDLPIYLASTTISCWRCGADMPAVGLIAPNVKDSEGEVCVLSDIAELPEKVVAFVQARFPSFKRTFSKTTRTEYYANTCPKCGVLSGDFYLHSEPGGPFFPESEADAAQLLVEQIPLDGAIEVEASLGVGCGDFILKYGTRRQNQTRLDNRH